MLSDEAKAELERRLDRARIVMTEIMEAGHSGTVIIGFGIHGLRFVYNRHEPSVQVDPEPKQKPVLERNRR